MADDKIINRIRKLLSLSESSNPHEAANAAAHAQRLMEKHRIDMASIPIDSETPQAEIDRSIVFKSGAIGTWRAVLVIAIGKVNNCRAYKAPGSMLIVGTEMDREITTLIYTWIAKQIDELARSYGGGRTAINQFRHGCVVTVRDRLVAAQAEAREGVDCTAIARVQEGLIRVNEWVSENMHTTSSKVYAREDATARNAGEQAGHSVSLRERAAIS